LASPFSQRVDKIFAPQKIFRDVGVSVGGKIVAFSSHRPRGKILSDASTPTAGSPRSGRELIKV
jgi:hypothetical protein